MRRILDYLAEKRIRMYRLSSDFVPYATHPELSRFHRQLEDTAMELQQVGQLAAALDIRLSLHPSQYVVLNTPDEEVARKSLWDLDVQARLLDALEQRPTAVVVLHVGGVYGNRQAARERFVANHARLSEPARRRLVIENDEFSFTIEDCLWIHERIGTPIVFDHQHHRLNPGTLDTSEAARRALATWPAGVVPKLHFSSPRLDGREVRRGQASKFTAPLLRQHADCIDPWTFADFVASLSDLDFDIMLEAKAKDLALLKLRQDLRTIGRLEVLRAPEPRAVIPQVSGG
jgi:UV DNA damage endonuclease